MDEWNNTVELEYCFVTMNRSNEIVIVIVVPIYLFIIYIVLS